MTAATAAMMLNSVFPYDNATAVSAGRSDWGRDIGRALLNQKLILFFIFPIFHSIWLSFSNLTLDANGIVNEFVKGANYHKILVTDPKYLNNVLDAIKGMLISVPFILVVSMVLALFLNGEYKGRIFFRGFRN